MLNELNVQNVLAKQQRLNFYWHPIKIPTVKVREVVTDFKKSIKIRSYIYDTVLVSASYCEPLTEAEPLPGRNQSVLFQ